MFKLTRCYDVLRFWLCKLFLIFLAISLSLSPAGGAAAPLKAVVLYPWADKPYRALFADLISGIEQRLGSVPQYQLTENYDPADLKQWLAQQDPQVVITLARLATQAYEASGLKIPYVIGGLDISPQTRPVATGISLFPDPPLLFATLKMLVPRIKRVFFVLNPNRERWIVEKAQQAAPAYGLTLVTREATDLRSAGPQYVEILKAANPDTDALWLSMDTALLDRDALLPIIIEQAWYRHLVVFSSNLLHVDMGVLFALYPDSPALGQRLAEMAEQVAKNPTAKPTIEPLREVKRALNLRVSSHLGLNIDKQLSRQFDLILPAY